MKLYKHTISNEEAEWLVKEFDALLRKQLAYLQISPIRADYDDLMQEGRIILIQTASEFLIDWQIKGERYRFMKVVGQRFRWHCLDIFRKPNYRHEHTTDPDDYQFKSEADPTTTADIRMIESQDLWQTIYQEVTPDEWRLLMALMDRDQKRQQIARDFSLTRNQLYSRRAILKKKLLPILNKWLKE